MASTVMCAPHPRLQITRMRTEYMEHTASKLCLTSASNTWSRKGSESSRMSFMYHMSIP